jgi:sulfur carrier protein
MRITLNGDAFDLPRPMTIAELLEHLQIDGRMVAVEYNLTIVKRGQYPTTRIDEGAEVEIVAFVGGG